MTVKAIPTVALPDKVQGTVSDQAMVEVIQVVPEISNLKEGHLLKPTKPVTPVEGDTNVG